MEIEDLFVCVRCCKIQMECVSVSVSWFFFYFLLNEKIKIDYRTLELKE